MAIMETPRLNGKAAARADATAVFRPGESVRLQAIPMDCKARAERAAGATCRPWPPPPGPEAERNRIPLRHKRASSAAPLPGTPGRGKRPPRPTPELDVRVRADGLGVAKPSVAVKEGHFHGTIVNHDPADGNDRAGLLPRELDMTAPRIDERQPIAGSRIRSGPAEASKLFSCKLSATLAPAWSSARPAKIGLDLERAVVREQQPALRAAHSSRTGSPITGCARLIVLPWRRPAVHGNEIELLAAEHLELVAAARGNNEHQE